LILLLGSHSYTAPTPQDTIPPSGKWLAPAEYSVITTNTIRVAVEAQDNPGGSGLAKAVFSATYLDKDGHTQVTKEIGEGSRPPYELLWDASNVPDQQFKQMYFSCRLTDSAGNAATHLELPSGGPVDGWARFVLDRNPAGKTQKLISFRKNRNITLDGRLDDWRPMDSLMFKNNGNQITVYSAWDADSLYFGIQVLDNRIISSFSATDSAIENMWEEDDIELFIDPDHGHNEIMNQRDQQFVFAPAGNCLPGDGARRPQRRNREGHGVHHGMRHPLEKFGSDAFWGANHGV
jgi:hypothetical protein